MAALPVITWGSLQAPDPPHWLISQAQAGPAPCRGRKAKPRPAPQRLLGKVTAEDRRLSPSTSVGHPHLSTLLPKGLSNAP